MIRDVLATPANFEDSGRPLTAGGSQRIRFEGDRPASDAMFLAILNAGHEGKPEWWARVQECKRRAGNAVAEIGEGAVIAAARPDFAPRACRHCFAANWNRAHGLPAHRVDMASISLLGDACWECSGRGIRQLAASVATAPRPHHDPALDPATHSRRCAHCRAAETAETARARYPERQFDQTIVSLIAKGTARHAETHAHQVLTHLEPKVRGDGWSARWRSV